MKNRMKSMPLRKNHSKRVRVKRVINKTQAWDIFAAVFSQKPNVCKNRLGILKLISRSDIGEMKFTELLRNVQSLQGMQSLQGNPDYNSQRLTYDLQVLKENSLIDQTSEGTYSLTKYGNYILDVYKRIEHELSENETKEKPGFVGGVTGTIIAEEFNHQLLADELCKLSMLKRAPNIEEKKIRIEFKDEDDDFESEIEISSDGGFAAQVIIYEVITGVEESFMEDLAKTAKWHEMAEGFAHVMLYYIDRTARRLWKTAEVKVVLGPDSYPLNIYTGAETT
jgi:predicted transcriptional regulator